MKIYKFCFSAVMRDRSAAVLLGTMLCLPHSGTAFGDVIVLSSIEHAQCSASLELEREAIAIRANDGCAISEASLRELLGAGLAAMPEEERGSHRSIFLGRLVRYPWLSAELHRSAARSGAWDARRGRAKGGGDNALVARLLTESGAMAALGDTVARHGYALVDVSVEKVLVGSGEEIGAARDSRDRLPFDAQVWLRVRRR